MQRQAVLKHCVPVICLLLICPTVLKSLFYGEIWLNGFVIVIVNKNSNNKLKISKQWDNKQGETAIVVISSPRFVDRWDAYILILRNQQPHNTVQWLQGSAIAASDESSSEKEFCFRLLFFNPVKEAQLDCSTVWFRLHTELLSQATSNELYNLWLRLNGAGSPEGGGNASDSPTICESEQDKALN